MITDEKLLALVKQTEVFAAELFSHADVTGMQKLEGFKSIKSTKRCRELEEKRLAGEVPANKFKEPQKRGR